MVTKWEDVSGGTLKAMPKAYTEELIHEVMMMNLMKFMMMTP